MPPSQLHRLPSGQAIIATFVSVFAAAGTGWMWSHSRVTHKAWQRLADTSFNDVDAWGEQLEEVRFSFGVMHQLCSVVLIAIIIWLFLTVSECARQMPPVQWDKYRPAR